MVCKEEVLLWFKDLDSYKRIDVLYELLNMCLPFELRFIGTCIEEIGKHTYQELRGPTITANDLEKLSKDVSFNQGILDESVRHRVLVYLSLLSSRNYSVANWLYKKVLRTEHIEGYLVKEKGKDELLHSEFLLLFTMALHHPAFTFDQKQFFSKVLATLIDFRENRVSAKHCALGYPPGFGYPPQKLHDMSPIPVKTTHTSCGDSPNYHQQPPGLSHLPPPPHVDFIAPMWNRPGVPYGVPPEMPPFPAPSISPLVSQAASPSQSRSTSPHRAQMGVRQPPPPVMQQPPGQLPNVPMMNGPPPPIDVIPNQMPPQLPIDQLSQSSLPVFNNPDLKPAEDDLVKLSSIPEEKLLLWPRQAAINSDLKPNGIRFPHFIGCVKPFLVEQMQALNVDGENSLHQSNSSSNSSPNETPPGTPSNTPATTPHGPGRGELKPRVNGMPHFGASPGPSILNTTSPPPPAAFSNSSVPYSYPQPFTALPPNRSMFHYTQAYRPTFTAQYPNYPSDSTFTYTFPYIPLVYSSPYQQPRTPPGCYNCGAPNHVGSDCTSQNIEEITQKKTYQLEFASPLPDSDK